jgi:hypothetical protein
MNKGRYRDRKKHKIHSPSVVGAMKTIRIDAKTQIIVPVTRSDEDARAMYHARINRAIRGPYIPAQAQTKALPMKELVYGSLEELTAAVIDDSNPPEQE